MRFGLGWRSELGAGILAHLDRIEVLEVLAEELFDAGRAQRRALRFLGAQVPIVLHATSAGLASPERVDPRRLERIARVVEWLEPKLWSEHLAFVRSADVEIGHLAAPPRNDATLAGLQRNVEEARRIVGSLPLVENVASLIDPPLSTYDEGAWLHAVLQATGCDLLLDLHNLYANATNFGFDAAAVAASLPVSRIGMIHLAGGKRIERDRVLDDHLHDVPDPVYELLALVQAPYVVLERDGNYPAVEELVGQLERARMSAGTAPHIGSGVVDSGSASPHIGSRVAHLANTSPYCHPEPQAWASDRKHGGEGSSNGQPSRSGSEGRSFAATLPVPAEMPAAQDDRVGSSSRVPAFLASLYIDSAVRARFLAAPYDQARAHGLSHEEATSLASINPDDLALAARSFAKKREAKARCRGSASRNPSPAAARE